MKSGAMAQKSACPCSRTQTAVSLLELAACHTLPSQMLCCIELSSGKPCKILCTSAGGLRPICCALVHLHAGAKFRAMYACEVEETVQTHRGDILLGICHGAHKKIKGELCAQALPRILAGAHLSSLVSPRHGPYLLVRSKFLRISPTSRGSARRKQAFCPVSYRHEIHWTVSRSQCLVPPAGRHLLPVSLLAETRGRFPELASGCCASSACARWGRVLSCSDGTELCFRYS